MESSVLRTNPLISRDDIAALHADLFRWCMSRCGHDRTIAEDLMQQTYVEVAATDERTEAQPPDFDAVWNAAEIRAKRRNRWPAVAAAFMAAVAICTQ